MGIATITSKGQLTLPKEIRVQMGVGPGDKVMFVKMEDGNFAVLSATQSVKSLKGIFKTKRKPVSLEDMDKAIVRGASGA